MIRALISDNMRLYLMSLGVYYKILLSGPDNVCAAMGKCKENAAQRVRAEGTASVFLVGQIISRDF